MDYEKKYKEALERAKKELDTCGSQDCDAARQIFRLFPELKESEDERIRKELIEHCRNTRCVTEEGAERMTKYIAWLEKQGELVNSLSKGLDNAHERIDELIQKNNKLCIKLERKPAWSEEDEHRIKLLEALCEDKLFESVPNSTMYEEMKITIDWLNSLRPQSKQEWNREDEKMIGRLRDIVEKYAFSHSAVDVNGELCEKKFIDVDIWLKSLKEKYTWKPSIAQLNALSIVSKGNAPDDIEAIMSLYNDLKKLTE